MFYIINTQGTTRAVITEPIYQGSVGVNSITLLAPFPSNVIIEVNAILPNGLRIKNLNPLTATIYPEGMPPIFDPNGKPYTTFSGIIDSSLTQQAGLVQIQFKVMLGVEKVLGTYMTSFNVSEGVSIESLPEPSADDYYDRILQYLAELNSDPLKSVVYRADNALVLPSEVSSNSAMVNTDPNATVSNIGGTGYFATTLGAVPYLAINFTYETPINAQLLQFYMNSPTVSTVEIFAKMFLNGVGVDSQKITINNTAGSVNINPRFYLGSELIDEIDMAVIPYDKKDDIFIKGIQVFKQNVDGEYVFTFKSGAQAIINAPDGATIEAYYNEANAAAQRAESSATEARESASAATESAIQSSAAASAATYNAGEAKAYADNASASATEAKESASQAEASAQEANAALQNILGRRNTFYEATMQLALGAILNNSYTLASGDLFIIGAKGVPDLIVFSANDEPIASATEIITQAQVTEGTFNVVPGGRYKLENEDGVIEWGVVAIESGFDPTNLVTYQELRTALASLDNAKQNKLPTTPSTVIGVDSTGEIVNYKIAQAVPESETDGDSIVNTAILSQALSQALGDIQTALTNIIALQNSYINGGNT